MYFPGTDQPLSYLEETGEMAQLIHAFDWSVTPLGTLPLWPRSLTTALDSILSADYPMFLLWGSEHTFFCNDAFASLFEEHAFGPALRTHVADLWPTMWTLVKPIADKTLKGSTTGRLRDSYMPIWRQGALQDAWWTLTFNRVRTDDGAINGMTATCLETTPQRLTSEEEASLQYILEACDLGTWELNPASMTFSCNQKQGKFLA